MQNIRQPAVAGTFYPAVPEQLDSDVRALLASAAIRMKSVELPPECPKAIVVPHAGYIYSGATAAAAYTCLSQHRHTIRRVVLLGPVHRVPVRGLALPGVDVFATPLGNVSLDQEAIASMSDLAQIEVSPVVHVAEHSLEVQLPFLQCVLDDFKLVPLAVGDASAQEVAEVLDRLWGGPETLFVISSDLSHYLPYKTACGVDRETADRILSLTPLHTHQQACGATPINGLLIAAKRHHLYARLIELRNSGDSAGDKEQVVGYGSFAFFEDTRHG